MQRDQLSEEQIFEAAFALESNGARNEYLQQVCRDEEQVERIQALLKEGAEDASFLEKGPAALQPDGRQPPDLPDRIGDFEILGELGRGGMGVVYRARQCSLNRLVALKVLSTGLGLSTKAIMRFKLEAEAAAKLHHTNIVPIYWTGEEKRIPYYAMELVDGPSLDRVIKQLRAEASGEHAGTDDSRDQHVPDWIRETLISSSPHAEVTASNADTSTFDSSSSLGTDGTYYDNLAKMMAGVADALAHAHDHGIVHRDIKPANLLLSADGRLSINDFGLARMLEQPGMTMTGELMGSPMYMSPEQITAGRLPLDHRTDIYSVGATLYELLTLRPPFAGQQRDQVLSQVIHKDPPKPRSINPRIPKDLETICMKAMEKDPDRRYQTAELLAEDLRRFVNRHAISARRTGPLEKGIRWIRKNKALSAMASLILVVGVSAGIIIHHNNEENQKETERLAEQHQEQERIRKMNAEVNLALEKAMSGRDAREHVNKAISYGADRNWVKMIEALEDMFEGKAAKAVVTLEDVVEEDPRNLTAKWMLAQAHVSNGKWFPYIALLNQLKDQYPERPEERVFAGLALSLQEPQKSIELMKGVLAEKPQLVYAQNALAFAMVFQAVDTRGGDSELAERALEELRTAAGVLRRTAAGVLREKDNPALASTRLYAHVTKAFLDFVRNDKPLEASDYLKTHAKADVDILAEYSQYQSGNWARLYYYQFTRDFDGMYGVMQDVIDHHHGGWVADPFWVTCFMKPKWAVWDPNWEYQSPLEMLEKLPDDPQLNLSRSIFKSTFLAGKDRAVPEPADAKSHFFKILKETGFRDDSNGDLAELWYFSRADDDQAEIQFLKEAGDSERRLSQAYYAIGMTKLVQGKREAAIANFEKCANGTMYFWTPYHWARALLDRMQKDENWPPPMPVHPADADVEPQE